MVVQQPNNFEMNFDPQNQMQELIIPKKPLLHCQLTCHGQCDLYTNFPVPFHLQHTLLTTWLQHHYNQDQMMIWTYHKNKLIDWETPFSSWVDQKMYLRTIKHLKRSSLWHYSLLRNTFLKNLHHIENSQLVCKKNQWTGFSLHDTSFHWELFSSRLQLTDFTS